MTSKAIKIGIIGGSGLDNPDILQNKREVSVTTPFGAPSDVLIEGEISSVPCVLLARHGRRHSLMPGVVNYRANIWALKEAGCTHIIASTATGSLREEIHPGDLVLLDNFIDRTQGRKQTFYDGGENSPIGVCHLPMEPAYCEKTRQVLLKAGKSIGLNIHEKGTVVAIEGPRFSSKAESNMYRSFGGSVINMTSVPEVVLAKEAGICYASVALATDYDCWRDSGEKVSVAHVLQTFKNNVSKMTQLILAVVPLIAAETWDETIDELQNTVKSSVMLPH